ncbi:MBL fold metallo-hydrolase [Azospirillum sp.]|uniref:MBL fold metallo-hydrolase n=1 Tax=Azospirillum sp. TaxID=34012 RepID=UPI003D7484D6
MTAAALPSSLERPAEAGTVQVAPGVHWVRMPLPFALDHINLWLLEDGPGWTLVDTGFNSEATRALWERLFAGVMGGRPITRVVATHFHPDHMGLAGWLAPRFDAAFHATLTEWLYGRMLTLEPDELARPQVERFYRAAGLPEDMIEGIINRPNGYRRAVVPLPTTLHRLHDGDALDVGGHRWRVVVGRGHAPEQACLLDEKRGLFIAGDQILPKISPNVSVWPHEPDSDPLSDFLETLRAFKALPPDVLVLPSHGHPFTGLHGRIDELLEHHGERLDETLAACAEPATAYEVMQAMFTRKLDVHQTRFAVGEAIAHLNHLVRQGRVVRERGAGAERYRRA